MPKIIRERHVEAYLVKRVRELGGEVRKMRWIGRDGAPDRVMMMPGHYDPADGKREVAPRTIWVEVKNPETIKTFPANAHERKQFREHQRMRATGQRVEVVGTFEQVDALLP